MFSGLIGLATSVQGVRVHAASLKETSASIEQMPASIAQNTENVKATNNMGYRASIDAATGGKAVMSAIDAMQEIAQHQEGWVQPQRK